MNPYATFQLLPGGEEPVYATLPGEEDLPRNTFYSAETLPLQEVISKIVDSV